MNALVCVRVCLCGCMSAAHAKCFPEQRPAASPVLVLRFHIGAMRQQRRNHRHVPLTSGPEERREPAVERARPHTAARV
jgi:hypothetical protein